MSCQLTRGWDGIGIGKRDYLGHVAGAIRQRSDA